MHEEADEEEQQTKTFVDRFHLNVVLIPEDVDEVNDFPEQVDRFHVEMLPFDFRTTTTKTTSNKNEEKRKRENERDELFSTKLSTLMFVILLFL